VDLDEVADCIVAFMRAFDTADWTRMRALLADPVHCDYAGLRGTPPGPVGADAYVDERRRSLAALRTEHEVTNFAVTPGDERADCRCDYAIRRFGADGRFFHSYGRYHFGLARRDGRWVIDAIRQEQTATEGDPSLHPGARGAGEGR
jgi:hypothetical protein